TKNNTFSLKSSSTIDLSDEYGDFPEVTIHDGKGIVDGIVNRIFDSKKGLANVSSSQASFIDGFESSEDMDYRLKRWQDVLRDRQKIQQKISNKTGKNPNEMLFNLPATVEQRDKGTIQRLMDLAARMTPEALSKKVPSVLPEALNKHTCMYIPNVVETLPSAEHEVEVSGLPNSVKKELLLPPRFFRQPAANEKSKWLNSKVLEKELLAKKSAIKRVLPHVPDIKRLEVVGFNGVRVDETENINRVQAIDLRTISSSTVSSVTSRYTISENMTDQAIALSEEINVGIKINGVLYTTKYKENMPCSDLRIDFQCEPYQIEVKEVLRLENVGKRVMICDWTKTHDNKRGISLRECDGCFLFDNSRIMLFPGEVYITKAVFSPRIISLSKQRWELKIFPNVFCIRRPPTNVCLQGKCVPSALYTNKLDYHHRIVVDKSNDQALKRLPLQQGKLAPIIESPELLCPYERALDEREIFNAQNVGHHCTRYDDLEELRALYIRIKVPRAPAWDLRLETIRQTIIRLPDVQFRAACFQKLVQIQEAMKSYDDSQAEQFSHSHERDRTRLIYVRGCIANGIEDWEELMLSIESTCLKSKYANFLRGEVEKPTLLYLTFENIQKQLLGKLRAKKYFRDSLYIQTYTHMCDIAENIVSIIESTEYI
ncbi:hypothetical protein KR044_008032, partial [Drosophila immigrans]